MPQWFLRKRIWLTPRGTSNRREIAAPGSARQSLPAHNLRAQLRLNCRDHVLHLRRVTRCALDQQRALERPEHKAGHFAGRLRKPEFSARDSPLQDSREPLLMRLEVQSQAF